MQPVLPKTASAQGPERGPAPRKTSGSRRGAALRALLRTPDRKPLPRIAYEMIRAGIRLRRLPRFYLENMLYREEVRDPDDYLDPAEVSQIHRYIRNAAITPFFENKILFQHFFRDSGLRLPRFFGYNAGWTFLSGAGERCIRDPAAFEELVKQMLAASPTGAVFLKPSEGVHGKRCYRIDSPEGGSTALSSIHERIRTGSFVFEESLAQHPSLAEVYPFSVNTLRIITCIRTDGRIQTVSALIRFGANRSHVDNASSGGVFCKVDLDSGSLGPFARKFSQFGGTIHPEHPDTGFPFAGFVVPHFAAAVEMVKAATERLPYRLVGWDVAITDTGPVLIEGNHNAHLYGAEMADGGYKRNAVFRAFMEEVLSQVR